jgi:transcriptional regulator with XRE-family HTH domain
MAGKPSWSARIRAERKARKWDVHATARRLRGAAGDDRHDLPSHADLVRSIRRWESGEIAVMSERYRLLYSVIFQLDEYTLFASDAESTAPAASMTAETESELGKIASLRQADRQIGGGHLYATVMDYLRTAIAPRLFSGPDGAQLFATVAAFTEMAGWMAHDAGNDVLAGQHFSRALDFAGLGSDRQLEAHVLGSISHITLHLGRASEAVAHAERGMAILTRARASAPAIHARLLARAASGLAAQQDSIRSARLLVRAEDMLGQRPQANPSPWTAPYDEATLALDTARCLIRCGQPVGSQHHARRFLSIRAASRTRSRALGQLTLAGALLQQDQLDEACVLISEAVDNTRSLSSLVVTRQLTELRAQLQVHQGHRRAADCLDVLEEAHRERCWLYQ